VDPAAHRLYVSRSTHVMVVDTRTDSLVGDIPNTPGVHGVALVPALGHGFTSNGRDSSVTVFDLSTLAVVTTVKLPARGPDAIVYDPASKRVFTFNGGSASATAIDVATNTVAGTVDLDGRPEFPAPDGQGRMYVNLEDSSAVVCFDTRSLKVLARWPLAPGEGPTGLALDPAHHRLFSSCDNHRLIVLDSESGKRVADLPIGGGVDGVAFDPGLQRVISSNGEGTLSVFHEDGPDRYASIGEVPTQRGARTLAVDETTHRVYTATAQFGETPAPTAERPHPRPSLVPGSFVVITLEATGAEAAKHK
jgi:DNA-binding beta-propeller fold protein YncE